MNQESKKRCRKCRKMKPISEFPRSRSPCRECRRAYNRKMWPITYRKTKATATAYVRWYRRTYPERLAAYNAVAKAIRHGLLRRLPCEVCGNPKTDAHHDDYSRPLDVRWFCRVHHKEEEGKAA